MQGSSGSDITSHHPLRSPTHPYPPSEPHPISITSTFKLSIFLSCLTFTQPWGVRLFRENRRTHKNHRSPFYTALSVDEHTRSLW